MIDNVSIETVDIVSIIRLPVQKSVGTELGPGVSVGPQKLAVLNGKCLTVEPKMSTLIFETGCFL